jgi:hypothetical protein
MIAEITSGNEGKKIIILQKQSEGTEVWLNLMFSKAADGGQISTLTTARKLNRSCRSLGSIEGLRDSKFKTLYLNLRVLEVTSQL